MSQEEWREIPGWNGLYDASTLGQVRRSLNAPIRSATRPGRIIGDGKPDSNTGYMRVMLADGARRVRYQVHRLVAMAFMEKNKPGMHINHKDGDKTNNALSNLEWATPSENVRHAWGLGLCKANKGSRHGSAVLSEETARIALDALSRGVMNKHVAEVFNVTNAAISALANGKTWRHLHGE